VEADGHVSLFGGMFAKGPRCQLYIGMLQSSYDSSRCKLCEAESDSCGFCNPEKVENSKRIDKIDRSERANIKYLNISASVYTINCLHWDENEELWTNAGCTVGR